MMHSCKDAEFNKPSLYRESANVLRTCPIHSSSGAQLHAAALICVVDVVGERGCDLMHII